MRAGVRWRTGGCAIRILLQRGMPGLADLSRASLRIDRAQRRKTENPFGEDRIGVAPQGFDARDAELGRTQRALRARLGAFDGCARGGAVELARKAQIPL